MLFILVFLMGTVTELYAADTADGDAFPFLISYDGADNASSMSHLLNAPAGKNGFIRVENGRFVDDHGPVRLNATNLTGPANFPTHEQSEKLARRLARFGFNCVRLHYFDASYGTFHFPKLPGIVDETGDTLRKLSKEQRDRQDYLIATLKKHGIYVDMNLHVARTWDERDGFVNPQPWADKSLDNFEPRMIQLQKEYAKELLGHVNPYTGLAYTDDPCIAVIEINNENSLFQGYRSGAVNSMAQVYRDELRRQWNVWLKKRYGTTAAVKESWKIEPTTLGDEQISDGDFAKPIKFDGKKWTLVSGDTGVKTSVQNGVLKLEVPRVGDQYCPKLHRTVAVRKDGVYTYSFRIRRAKGSGTVELTTAVAEVGKGWRSLGVHQRFKVGSKWKTVKYVLQAPDTSETVQLQMTRFAPGTYEIDDLSFKAGAEGGYTFQGTLQDSSIPIVDQGQYAPWKVRADFTQFLFDTEDNYWSGIYRYLKDELKAKSIVSGTQLGYSPPQVQAKLDYIDNHAYWSHPSPVSEQWRIRNTAMVRSMGCITGLAGLRVHGKPYTVSEYNHPFPNLYGAEGQPMLRAYGSLQGWDGVFEYTYNHSPNFEPRNNGYFFSIIARTDVLAHFPACSAIYLRGDVQEAKLAAVACAPLDEYMKGLAGNQVSANIETYGVDSLISLVHKTAIRLDAKTRSEIKPSPVPSAASARDYKKAINSKIIVSDTGELIWNREVSDSPYWLVDTPNTKLFTGFPKDRTVKMGDVSLTIGKTRLDWATVSLVSRYATGFGSTGKANILLAATGYCGNEGMVINQISKETIRLEDWGNGSVVAEGIPAVVTLKANPASVKCYALDPEGKRKMEVAVKAAEGGAQIAIGPEYKTVWYEIDVK